MEITYDVRENGWVVYIQSQPLGNDLLGLNTDISPYIFQHSRHLALRETAIIRPQRARTSGTPSLHKAE